MAALTGGDGSGLALAERPSVAVDERIRAAALRCLARTGLRRTTLDDVGREARCSRATIYRAFPGGKDVLMADAATREIDRILADLQLQLAAATTLTDALVIAMTGTTRSILGHDALVYVMVNEPGVVMPYLSFQGLDPVLARAVDFLAPSLERFLEPQAARRTSEWATRLVVLYSEPGAPLDLTDPADARRLVTTHVLPGLEPTMQQEPRL